MRPIHPVPYWLRWYPKAKLARALEGDFTRTARLKVFKLFKHFTTMTVLQEYERIHEELRRKVTLTPNIP